MPSGRTAGTIIGGIGGAMFGPGGALIGAGLGGAIGGAFDDSGDDGARAMPRVSSQYGSQTNNVAYGEAERASQIGAQQADAARAAGRDIGVGANAGIATAGISREAADRRAGGL